MKYTEFPRCGQDYKRADYTQKIIRYFEDSTGLTSGSSTVGATTADDGITPDTAARMARCGVDLVDMDQILPDDGRLAGLVWSWAQDQPAKGDCAVQVVSAKYPFGRWESRPCTERHRIACRTRRGTWHIARGAALPARQGPGRCQRARTGAQNSVPRTGYEAQRLRLAMRAARTSVVARGPDRRCLASRYITATASGFESTST